MKSDKPARERRNTARETDPGRGREARHPAAIPWQGWKDVLWRVWRQATEDRVTLIAAGATFYLLLALFPAMAAFVSVYGFVADPAAISAQVETFAAFLPEGGVTIIQDQLESLASQDSDALSLSFIAGLLVAFWSANNGTKTLFEALNVAYEEREKRSFVKLTLVTFAFTLGVMLVATAMIVVIGVLPAVLALVNLDGSAKTLIALLRWPVLLALAFAAITVLYRYGPSRERAKWRWITLGAVITTVVWVVASFAFSWYLQNFADYNATYGSLGAVIGFMLWTWVSVLILIVGAELNSELEHQTARDSTTGNPQPMGRRGAVMADTLGRKSGED